MHMRANRLSLIVAVAVLSGSCGAVSAACTNALANAKAQELGQLFKQKMQAKPDEIGDLAGEFGDVMTDAANGVTEQTCTRLDDLLKKARAL